MRCWNPWGVALLILALLAVQTTAQDKAKDAKDAKDVKDAPKKADDKKPDMPPAKGPDKKDPEKKPPKTVTLGGELVHIEPGKQAFRLKVTTQYPELNQSEAQAMQQEQYNY